MLKQSALTHNHTLTSVWYEYKIRGCGGKPERLAKQNEGVSSLLTYLVERVKTSLAFLLEDYSRLWKN